jgi:hypothetical protein
VYFLLIHDLKRILTEVRVVKMVNEAPTTIAGFDRTRLKCPWGVLSVDTHDLKPILTEVRIVKMVNEAPRTIASFARNRLRARLKCPWGYVREEREICHGFTQNLTPNQFHLLQKSNDITKQSTPVRKSRLEGNHLHTLNVLCPDLLQLGHNSSKNTLQNTLSV